MDPRYFPPPNRPQVPGEPGLIILSAYGLCTGTLLLPRAFPFRRYLPVPPILYLLHYTRSHRVANVGEDYIYAIQLAWLLIRWTDLVICHDVDKDTRRVKDDGKLETVQDVSGLTFWERLTRSLNLLSSLRGVGWNWEVKLPTHVPKGKSRRRFVLGRCLDALRAYLGSDLTTHLCSRIYALHPLGTPYAAMPTQHQIALAWCTAFRSGYDLAISYHMAAALAVALRLDRPQSYPPLNGDFAGCYTIRKVWGYGWHQYLRRPFEASAKYLATMLRVRKGSLMNRYFKLYWAFFFSAAIHHVGSLNIPYTDGARKSVTFFCLQPVAITIEDALIAAGRRVGCNDSGLTRLVGFAWVITWFSWALRFGVDIVLTMTDTSMRNPVIVFSVADWLFGKP